MPRSLKKYCYSSLLALIFFGAIGVGVYYCHIKQGKGVALVDNKARMPYTTEIIEETKKNVYFRKVLFTGARSPLVVMDIPPGGEIGEETHKYTEQTLLGADNTPRLAAG